MAYRDLSYGQNKTNNKIMIIIITYGISRPQLWTEQNKEQNNYNNNYLWHIASSQYGQNKTHNRIIFTFDISRPHIWTEQNKQQNNDNHNNNYLWHIATSLMDRTKQTTQNKQSYLPMTYRVPPTQVVKARRFSWGDEG
jgi:hypothetical protein